MKRWSILFELRYPTRWYTKLLAVIVVLIFFTVLSTAAIASYLVYRIVEPSRTSSEINLQSFPGRPDLVQFAVANPGNREGYFFPGFRGAPTILVCHGYGSSRGEMLTLVSALQDHQYNVFVFDFAAHGKNGGTTTLGYREANEVRAAIDTLALRTDVDPIRFGVWGYNLGAYAALSEAETDKRVRALVLDSIYDHPEQMVKLQVEKTGLARFPFMVDFAQLSFRWLNSAFRHVPPLSKNIRSTAGVPKLYIQDADDPELAEYTRQLYLLSPEPKEQTILPRGNFAAMSDDDKRDYQNLTLSFFLENLPPVKRAGR
ncbi:MAG TPA: alpha/beta fold hydrolase [Methylomirabilota bacterium]|nr:alpha/beta fold hydrolase [Methylomirabilota bacterium]